jgi:SAM-dependent methyltransferase
MDYNDYNTTKELSFWHRARLGLINYLLSAEAEKGQEKLLDIGCGTGTELQLLAEFGELSALDINPQALKLAEKMGFKTVLGDIEKMELAKENYSLICCFDVLEHLSKDQDVLKKIYASLVPGGKLIVTVPAFRFLFSRHDLALTHHRRYSKKELRTKLEQAGLEVSYLNYWNTLLFLPIASVRLIKKFIEKSDEPAKSDLKNYTGAVEKILFKILNFENKRWVRKLPLPFGVSLYAVAKKL